MSQDAEFARLIDLMPASGRMYTKLVQKSLQARAIETPFPMPWNRGMRRISVNYEFWRRLAQPQRDLLFLRAVCWLTQIRWFKPDLYQGAVAAGAIAMVVELSQGDAVGVLVSGGLGAIAAAEIWRRNRSIQTELDADEAAVKVAQRRGYDPSEAATHLLEGIEAAAAVEGRPKLSFAELMRCQNLKVRANLSPVGVPGSLRDRE